MNHFLKIAHSDLRKKLLLYFFTNPEAHLYLREIAGILKVDPGNLSKELMHLEKEGVFISNLRGNQKYLHLNKEYRLFKELKSIILKTIGIQGYLKQLMDSTRNIDVAFIYGSFAAGEENRESDIDLLIMGKPDEDHLSEQIEILEKNIGREINFNIYPKDEFCKRIKKKDSFILNILERPKIALKGNIDEF